MIAKLSGEIVDVRDGYIVLDVNGVGYLLAVTDSLLYTEGTPLSLYTHLAVRENALDLYGFKTQDEFALFEELIKLPKIGPKTGLQILSQADVKSIQKAVAMEDPSYLSKISGIGKKSAEKIVLGLKDVLDVDDLEDTSPESASNDADVIETLITLGYSQKDALEAVQKIPKEVETTEERVKHSLKYVSN